MSTLLGGLATELEDDVTAPDRHLSPSTSSPTSPIAPRTGRRAISEKNKIIAASTGALVTSLTMTPFDVIKTRLQTQSPSSSSPTPHASSSTSPWPPPIASTSSSLSSASHLSTSIVKPYFSPSSSASATLSLPTDAATGARTIARPHHLSGFWDAVSKIVRHEGLAAMWRGTAPAIAMSVPGQVVYMVGYDWGRRTAFARAPAWAYSASSPTQLSATYLTLVPLLAGSVSRTCVAALVSPLELVRTRLQASHSSVTLMAIFRTLRADGGWTTAWRGLPPTLWRDVPFSGIYWAGYEGIKRSLTGGKGMGEGWEEEGVGKEFGVAFISGAGSGMIAATLTNPFDVVKTRRQALSYENLSSAPSKTFALLFHIAKNEGWLALMNGLTPRLAKVGPACGVMVGCYEGFGKWLD